MFRSKQKSVKPPIEAADQSNQGKEMTTFKVISSADQPRQQLTDHGLITGLRQYISKNKTLPDYFAFADEDRETQDMLLPKLIKAVATGNYDDDIFVHPVCDNLILYAVEKELIPFWPGMTAYTYVTALAQFTFFRKLKHDNADVKSWRRLTIATMVQDGKITEFGNQYLAELSDFLRAYGVKHQFAKLRNAILRLPVFEQSLIRIDRKSQTLPGKRMQYDTEVSHLLKILLGNLPFCDGSDGKTMLLPSHGLVNVILQQIEGQHVQMMPVFGRVTDETRDALHAQDQHPVSLYSNSVKNNVYAVHGLRAGPIPIWLHDIGHTVWGTILGLENRNTITSRLMPILNRIIERGDNVRSFKRLRSALNDFDLSPLSHYINPQEGRLGHYAGHCMSHANANLAMIKALRAEIAKEVGAVNADPLNSLLNSLDEMIRMQREEQLNLMRFLVQATEGRHAAFHGFDNVVHGGRRRIANNVGFFGGRRGDDHQRVDAIENNDSHHNRFNK